MVATYKISKLLVHSSHFSAKYVHYYKSSAHPTSTEVLLRDTADMFPRRDLVPGCDRR